MSAISSHIMLLNKIKLYQYVTCATNEMTSCFTPESQQNIKEVFTWYFYVFINPTAKPCQDYNWLLSPCGNIIHKTNNNTGEHDEG